MISFHITIARGVDAFVLISQKGLNEIVTERSRLERVKKLQPNS